MRVCEAQHLGALVLLMAALLLYGVSVCADFNPGAGLSLPWGNQAPGSVAVEVSGNSFMDGIYFLPRDGFLETLEALTKTETAVTPASSHLWLDDHAAMGISIDGDTVRIGDMTAIARLALGLPIDLNTASEEEMQLVPGVGKRLATDIVELRRSRGRIQSLSELMTVPGIKEKRLAQLRRYMMVRATP